MRRALALGAVLALAACGDGSPDPAPAQRADPAATEASVPDAPQRQIGTISNLGAETSGLTGTVSDFAVERTDVGTRVSLAADTLFAFDKATLTPEAQANLIRTAALVREGGDDTVTVTGHTDAKGEDGYNLALSRRRADAVVAWLRGQPGLAARSYTTVGKGETEPVADETAADGGDDAQARARNRRVTVDIPR